MVIPLCSSLDNFLFIPLVGLAFTPLIVHDIHVHYDGTTLQTRFKERDDQGESSQQPYPHIVLSLIYTDIGREQKNYNYTGG